MHVATRLCRRVHRLEIPIVDESLLLSVSIGVAMHKVDDDLESLVERADQAMYRAKLNGRNQVFLHAAPTGATASRLRVVEKQRGDH
jgi:diguanylate cyclase (GGDEF)-like protein